MNLKWGWGNEKPQRCNLEVVTNWRDQHWALLGKEPTHLGKGRDSHQNSPCRCNPGTDTQLYLTWASRMWVPEGSSHNCYPPSINKLRSLEVPWLAQGDRSLAVSQMELCMFGRGGWSYKRKVEDSGTELHLLWSSQNNGQGLGMNFKFAVDSKSISDLLLLPKPRQQPAQSYSPRFLLTGRFCSCLFL